ncbi:titin-like isoform X1 [Gigantopelta aegis]|uniref:titin-like isoform X1 n=1 Tax=Gigantopelta aegis TaxID=1735272 RepID=UPI001B887D6E|nr:titin-like isoform X1 [Gigantopelta aegis]XP_041364130.1 titin-like isoform X1 [Gigantopelta aegis]
MEDEDVLDRIMRHRFLLGTFDGDSIRARDASSPETSEAAPEIVTATDEQPPETSELGATASEPTPEKEIETPPPEDIEPPPPEEIEPPPPEEIEPSPQEDVVPAEDIVPEETDQSIKAEMKDDTRGGKAQYRPDSHNTADNEDDLDRIMRQRFLSLSEDSDDFPRRREPPPEEIEPPPPEDIEPPPPEEIEPPPPEEIEPPPPEEIVAPSPEEIEPSPQDVAPADDIAPDQTDESIKAEMEDETGTYQSPVLTDLVKKLNKPAGGLEGLLGTPDEEPMVFRRAMYYPDDYNTTDDEDILDRINRHRHILGTKDGNGYLRRSEPPPEMSEVAPVIATATDEQPPEEIEPPPPEESEPLPPEEIEPPLPEEIEPPSPEEIEPSPQEDTAPAEDIAPEMTDESIKAEMEDETVPTEPDEKRGSPQYRPDDHNTADNEDDLDRIMRQRFLSLSEDSDDFPRRSERQPEMSEVAPVTATDEQPPEEIEPPPPEESEPLPPEEIKPPLPEEIEPPSPEEIEPSPQEDTAPAEDIAPEMTDESIKAEMEDETVPTEPDEKRGSPQYRPDDHNTADNEDDLDRIMRQRFLSLSEDSDDFPRRSERQPEMSEVAPVTATDEQPPEEIEPPPPEEIEPPPPEEIEPPPPEESEPPPPEEIEPPPEETEPPPPEETEPPPPEETEPPPPEESEPPPPEEIEPPPPEETEPPPPEESEAPPPEEIEPSPEEAVAPVEGVAPKESDGRIQAEMEKDTPCGLDTCRSRFLTKLVPMLSEPPEGDLGTEEENPQYLRLDDYNVTDNEDILDRIMRNRFLLRSKDSDDAQKKDEPPPEMSEVVPVIATASDQQPPEEIEPPPPEEIEPPPIEEIEPPSPEETEPPSLEETEPPPPEETESPPPEEIEPPPPEESELQALESEPPPPEEIEPPPPEESEPSPQEAVAPVEDVAPKESDGRIRAEMEKDTPCGLDTCRSRFLTKLVPMLSEPPEGDLGTEEENPQYLRLDDYNVTDDEDILDRIMRNRFLLGSKDSEDAGEKDEPPSEMSEVAPVIPTTSDQQPADEIETPAPEERELQQFESTPTPPEEIEPTPLEEIEPPPQEETEPPLPEEIEPPNPEEIEPPPPEETEPPPPEETEPPPPEESEPSPQEAVAPVEDVAPKESDGRIRAEMEKDTPCGLDTCRSRFLTKLVPMLSEPPEGDLGTEEENPQYLRLDDYNVTDDEDILDRIMRNRFLLGSKDRDDAGEKDEPPSEMSEVAPVIPTTSDQQPADEIETPAPEERELQQFESTPTFPEEIEPTPPEEIEPPPQEETEPPLPEEIEPPPPEEIEPPPPEETEPPPPEEIEPPPPEESETQTPESEPPPPEEIEPPPPEESEPSPQEAVAPVEDVVPKESDGCIRAEMEKDTPCGLDTCRSRFLTKLVPMLSEPLEGDLGMEEENPQYLRLDDYNITDDEDILDRMMRDKFFLGPKNSNSAQKSEESEPQTPEETEPPHPEETEPPSPEETKPLPPKESEPPLPEEIEPQPPEESEPPPPEDSEPPLPPEQSEPPPPEESESPPPEEIEPPSPEDIEPAPLEEIDLQTPEEIEPPPPEEIEPPPPEESEPPPPEESEPPPPEESEPSPQEAVAPVEDVAPKESDGRIRAEMEKDTPCGLDTCRSRFLTKLVPMLSEPPEGDLGTEEENPQYLRIDDYNIMDDEDILNKVMRPRFLSGSKDNDGAPPPEETEPPPPEEIEPPPPEEYESPPPQEDVAPADDIVPEKTEIMAEMEDNTCGDPDTYQSPMLTELVEKLGEPPEGLEGALCESEDNPLVLQRFMVRQGSNDFEDYTTPSRLAHVGEGACITETDSDGLVDYTADVIADVMEPELTATLPMMETDSDIPAKDTEDSEPDFMTPVHKEELRKVFADKLEEELMMKLEDEPKEELMIEESKEEPEIVETEEEPSTKLEEELTEESKEELMIEESKEEPEIVETEEEPSTRLEEELMEKQEEEPKEELMIEESKEEPEIVETEEEPSTRLEEELMEKQDEEPKEELKMEESKEEPEIVETEEESAAERKFSVADSDLSDGYAVPSRLAHTGFGPDMQEPELAAALPTQEKEPDIVETEEVPSTKPEEELMENQEEELSIEESKEEPEIVETEEEPSTKLEELTEKQEEEPKEELKIEESKEEPEIVETEEESAAERKFSVADSDLSDGYAVPSRLAHTGFDPDMQEPELAAALPIQEKEPEIVETEDVPSTKPEEELMENQEEEPKEELMIEESKEEPEIVDTEEEPSTKLEEELMEKQEEEPKEELKIKESKIVEMKQEICTPAKKLPVETKGRKNSAGDYENPELILRKLQKVHVNKAKMETPTKASEIMDELKRLNSLLVDDQRRLFEESLWGKEAIHEIMKLEELKSILERQVDAGGDGSIPNKQLNMFQLELDDREQLLMKIMTLYHQCESELQATQQELFYLQEYIAMLETQYTQSEDLNREAVDELKKKAEIIVCLRTELQQVKCILDQAQLQNEQLRTKIKQLMEDIKKLTIDKKDLEAKIDRERLTSEEVERVYRQTMEELVQKCNLLVALEMEVQQAKNLLGNVEETRTMLQKNIEELTVHVTQATSMHESVEVTIARERASMAKRRLSASVIKEQHDMKLQQLEAMNRDRALLLKNIADERDKSEKLREALDKKENSVEDQVSQLTTSQQEIDRQLEEMAMLKERAEQLEKEKALVLTDYNNLCKQLDEKGQELSDMQDSYDLKIESMKNVVMLQQTGREQITKSYKIAITSARDEIKSLNVVMRHKEVQLQSYSGALQELQEIFMYSFFKSSNIQS